MIEANKSQTTNNYSRIFLSCLLSLVSRILIFSVYLQLFNISIQCYINTFVTYCILLFVGIRRFSPILQLRILLSTITPFLSLLVLSIPLLLSFSSYFTLTLQFSPLPLPLFSSIYPISFATSLSLSLSLSFSLLPISPCLSMFMSVFSNLSFTYT